MSFGEGRRIHSRRRFTPAWTQNFRRRRRSARRMHISAAAAAAPQRIGGGGATGAAQASIPGYPQQP